MPTISNRTEILILQHSRERKHAFNTARMVDRALENSRIIFGTNGEIAKSELNLTANTGILYPSQNAECLAEIPADRRPDQLIVIDGTWSQAKTMVRDIPQLQDLPHYKINPTQPGQYKIRLEPTDTSLSTVEATVAALKETEPDTENLDELLGAFATMVDRQLHHPKVGRECYSGGPQQGRTINVPGRLRGDPSNIVVAYGEVAYRDCSGATDGVERQPLVWLAQRLDAKLSNANATFSRALTPQNPLTDSFLEHLRLPRSYFDGAILADQFCEDWGKFLRPDDVLVVFNHGNLRLLKTIGARVGHNLTLKSIHFDEHRKTRTVGDFLDANAVAREWEFPADGRAGSRLANAIALVHYLRAQSGS